MATPLKDAPAFGTFLDTYNRLTASETPRDLTALIGKILAAHGSMKLDELIETAQVSAKALFPTLDKLKNLEAIELTGSGFDQTVELTSKGHDLLDLFT